MPHERRHFIRVTFDAPARLATADQTLSVHILDLSLKGALVAVAPALLSDLLAFEALGFAAFSQRFALRDALRASVANVGANLLAGVLFVGALVLAAVVVALMASLLAVMGGLLHPKLGALLLILTLLGFAAVVLVTVVGAAYLAGRDTCGDGAAPPPPPEVHGFGA